MLISASVQKMFIESVQQMIMESQSLFSTHIKLHGVVMIRIFKMAIACKGKFLFFRKVMNLLSKAHEVELHDEVYLVLRLV